MTIHNFLVYSGKILLIQKERQILEKGFTHKYSRMGREIVYRNGFLLEHNVPFNDDSADARLRLLSTLAIVAAEVRMRKDSVQTLRGEIQRLEERIKVINSLADQGEQVCKFIREKFPDACDALDQSRKHPDPAGAIA